VNDEHAIRNAKIDLRDAMEKAAWHPAKKAQFERARTREVVRARKLITGVKPIGHKAERIQQLLHQMAGNNGIAAEAVLTFCRAMNIEYGDMIETNGDYKKILALLLSHGLRDED